MQPAKLRESVTILALLIAAALGGLSVKRYRDARAVIAETRLSSLRAEGQDRLIGKRIDVATLTSNTAARPTDTTRRSTLIWVVELDRCSGCFDTVSEWARLEQIAAYDLKLVLVGHSTPAVEARLRALGRTTVRWGKQERVDSALGNVLPNTKLLLDPDGIALLVDTRASGQECGWNFEAQIGALQGLGTAGAIRTKRDWKSPAPERTAW